MGLSTAEQFARLPAAERAALLERLTVEEQAALAHDWGFWGRPEQQTPEGAWRIWLALAGRGWGKTRTGAEFVREEHKHRARGILAGPTAGDVRDVMIEGESGLLNICPEHERPRYEPSKRRLTFPNGSRLTVLSADEPDRFRGQQCEYFWADELAAWRYPDAWDQLMFGLRLGNDPRGIVTTTPRPKTLIRELRDAPTTHVTTGSTHDNSANLAEAFLDTILAKYEGTSLGQQEIYAQILDEAPGALWTRALLERNRIKRIPRNVELVRTVVAVDPAVTNNKNSDETGIIVAALGSDDKGYIIADYSLRASPNEWAKTVVKAYHQHEADRVIAEVNQGGDMVAEIVHQVDQNIPITSVRASKGKHARAEPVAGLTEQNRIKFLDGLTILEDQLCTYTISADYSPDRLDAFVWACKALFPDRAEPMIRSLA